MYVADKSRNENAYVTSEHDGALSQFAISPATGKITPLSPPTVPTASGSLGLAITPYTDLSAKVSAPATAKPGQALTYAIKISAAGPSQAWQAAVTDRLPAGAAFRSATTASGDCTVPRAGTRGAIVACHLAKLKADAAWRIQITITVKASTGTIRDRAAVTSVTPDPHSSNNTAIATTKITTQRQARWSGVTDTQTATNHLTEPASPGANLPVDARHCRGQDI